METHTTLPDGEDLQWLGEVIGGFVEQDLSEPAAEDDAEHAVEEQVVELFDADRCGLHPDALPPQPDELQEGEQVHQTVPVHRDGPDGKSDRVELRVDQHCQ